MNYYDYHYHNNEHNHDNMNQGIINNHDNIDNHDNINQDNMVDKDNENITVIDYDNRYNNIFTSVLLLSFMTGAFIYIGNYTYLKLVDYFNSRYNDDSLTEHINVDKLDSVVVLNNLPENECCICLEEYKENDILIKLKCNHMFHKECLEPWFNNNKKSCPLCRYKLV